MVSVITACALDSGFESRSDQSKDYKIGICCFFAKNAALRNKSKDWLASNQNSVFEWTVSVNEHYKNPTQGVDLVQSEPHHHHHLIKM